MITYDPGNFIHQLFGLRKKRDCTTFSLIGAWKQCNFQLLVNDFTSP